jgi:hypothetical protein
MTNLRQVAQQALEALENLYLTLPPESVLAKSLNHRITDLRKALEQPEQEPVAVKHMMEWVELLKRQSDYGQHMCIPGLNAGVCFSLGVELEQFINTTPPQRPWQGLTDEEFLEACQLAERGNYLVAFQRIQTKLKERNNGP